LALGDVLHSMMDKDKDGQATRAEVNQQLGMLGMMLKTSNGSKEGAESETVAEFVQMFESVKEAAPAIFSLLDSDGDEKLSKPEFKYLTHFEKSVLEGGAMEDFAMYAFTILDGDGDDQLSVDELLEGSNSPDKISRVTDLLHALFPVRETPQELLDFVRTAIASVVPENAADIESVVESIAWLDDNDDKHIQREEAREHYNIAAKKFRDIATAAKQMGPLMTMLEGFNAGGGKIPGMMGEL